MRAASLSALGATLLFVSSAAGQIRPQTGRFDTDIEVDSVTHFTFSVTPHVVLRSSNEIFEDVGRGLGGSFGFGAGFASRYAARLRVGVTGYADDLSVGSATSFDVGLETLWVLPATSRRLEVGPTFGATWLNRDILRGVHRGLFAGGSVGVFQRLSDRLDVMLGLSVTWSTFGAPDFIEAPVMSPDNRAEGKRVRLSLGITQRIPRR